MIIQIVLRAIITGHVIIVLTLLVVLVRMATAGKVRLTLVNIPTFRSILPQTIIPILPRILRILRTPIIHRRPNNYQAH